MPTFTKITHIVTKTLRKQYENINISFLLSLMLFNFKMPVHERSKLLRYDRA